MKSPKEMIESIIKKGLTKRRISKILGVQWSTVNSWHKKDVHPEEDTNLNNLHALYQSVCRNGGKK